VDVNVGVADKSDVDVNIGVAVGRDCQPHIGPQRFDQRGAFSSVIEGGAGCSEKNSDPETAIQTPDLHTHHLLAWSIRPTEKESPQRPASQFVFQEGNAVYS